MKWLFSFFNFIRELLNKGGIMAFVKKGWHTGGFKSGAFEKRFNEESDARKRDDGFTRGEGGDLLMKALEIGDWNMDATLFVAVPHKMDFTKIRGVSVIIRDDNDQYRDVLTLQANAGSNAYGKVSIDKDNVSVLRVAGQGFDNALYDKTGGYNRGWITLWYAL